MRIPRTVALLILAAAPSLARAAQVQVTSSTQYLWYQDYQSDHGQQDVAEYLRLNAFFGEKDAFKVYGYGRLVGQLYQPTESRPEITDQLIGRLYYLFLDYREAVPGHLDLQAGRLYSTTAAATALVDGLHLDLKHLGLAGLGATVVGGRRVLLDNRSEVGTGKDSVWGASLYYDTVALTHLELSYGRFYAEKDLARDNLALDVSTTPHAMVNLYGRATYDFVSSRYGEVLAGLRLMPISALVLRGELYESVPTFDKYSFYTFFNVNRYREASLGLEVRAFDFLSLEGRYAHEGFGEGATADLWEAGARIRPVQALFLNASYEKRQGYAGRLGGLRLDAGYKIAMATLQAGADYDDFRRQESRDGTAKRYWGGALWDFSKVFGVQARVEMDMNYRFSRAYQGWLAANVHL
jgi:hypothetical protein